MTPSQLHQIDCSIAKAMGFVSVLDDREVCLVRRIGCHSIHKPFQPTRNPTDAMEVQKWLVEQGLSVVLQKYTGQRTPWHCWRLGSPGVGKGKTPEIAISLFAERVIEGEK